MTTPAKRKCHDCDMSLPKRRFSRNQWKKGRGASRCQDCIAGGDVQAASGGWLNERDDDDGSDNDMTLAECLHEMCNFCCVNWSFLETSLKLHPEDAREIIIAGDNQLGEYDCNVCPLHVVLRYDPPLRTVKALVRANPDAFDRQKYEETPLRRACRNHANPELVRYLLDATLRSDHYNDPAKYNPISFIIEDEIKEATIELLLKEYPDGARLAGDEEICPLDMIILTSMHSMPPTDSILRKLALLLEAAERVTIPKEWKDGMTFRPLHSLLRWITRPSFPTMKEVVTLPIVRRWMGKRPDLFLFPEDDPIHTLLSGILLIVRRWMRNSPDLFLDAEDDGPLPIHTLLSGTPLEGLAGPLVDILLEGRPGSAMAPAPNFQLPLHLALMNQWPDECIRRLLEAFPGALQMRDPITNLYPFQMAACKWEKPITGGTQFDEIDNDISKQLQREEKEGLKSRQAAEHSRRSSTAYQLCLLNLSYTLLLQDPTLVLP